MTAILEPRSTSRIDTRPAAPVPAATQTPASCDHSWGTATADPGMPTHGGAGGLVMEWSRRTDGGPGLVCHWVPAG